jgi:hypothetical protein
MVGSLLPNSIASSLANNPAGASGTMTMSIPNSVQGVGLPSSMVRLICNTGIYRQVLLYARDSFPEKVLHIDHKISIQDIVYNGGVGGL